MTGELLTNVLLAILGIFTAIMTPIAVVLGRKAADYFEQKTKIQLKAEYRQALEYAIPTAIAATEEWARKQLQKPSAQEKFAHAAREARTIAPKAVDAAGAALATLIEGKVPLVRASLATSYAHTASSLPPPDRVDTSRLGPLPRPPRLP